ncbi:hypothetical protein GA0070564_102479 [Micromonospora mirobrigensis]|uniref:Uncharacterized protein n=1 Tax=Micromonospora mirobrigensis TaxID=262898 RepID=A0A1C4WSI2_9ACTN|nr:hypothetical protein GA0070564_102479 [Micromonospora mirobrigensis]
MGETPAGWPVPDDAALAAAREAALGALTNTERTGRRLGRYYDPTGNFAGATYRTVTPNDPGQITAADLFAVTLLSVRLRAASARRVLDDELHRETVQRHLAAVPENADLAQADATTLVDASSLYEGVKRALASPRTAKSDPWVTASKLCARKRPSLLPVRDRKVRELLGIPPKSDHRHDWLIHRALMRDSMILNLLRDAKNNATTRDGIRVDVQDPSLRTLDVVLWTHAINLDAA